MVMAQHTNTQYVAHEFVKQYYTMLHKDPSQLHRFYTKESCLTHGGSPNAKSEEPVCGQEAIYEKIAQLNFHNCYAKIRSVDSHPTIGGGVVIQVNGELSNSGLVMRKFMQTFVLAQQEPKKYHVLNDIFRYQDETFEDTENDETVDGTVESENGYQTFECVSVAQMDPIPDEQEVPNIENKLPENNIDEDYPYSNSVTTPQQDDEGVIVNGGDIHEESDDGGEQEDQEKINGLIDNEEPLLQDSETLVESEAPLLKESEQQVNGEQSKAGDGGTLDDYDASTNGDEETVETTETTQEPQEPEGPPKPFTWAALTKKNTPVSQAPPVPATKPPPKKPSPSGQRTQKKREEVVTAQPPPPKKEQPTEEPRKRNPDNHQIFIGNLPSNVTEKDVREAFSEFGNIVEIRLNPKNFGFIAFDGPDAPIKILNKTKTIVINNNTINTEVKRSVSGGSGRGMGGGGSGGGFRRGDKDGRGGSDRRSDNKNRNTGNRSGKNSFGQQKQQQRSSEDGKTDNRIKDTKGPREQRTSRR